MLHADPAADDVSVVAVVVTYRPDDSVGARLGKILAQVDAMVVVDNRSSGRSHALLAAIDDAPGCAVIHNSENRGIASALNQGVAWARGQRSEWIVLFDQDSDIQPRAVKTLIDVWQAYPEPERVGVVGAGYAGSVARTERHGHAPWYETDSVITSGSLVRSEMLDTFGPFREDFFIDMVDIEFCLRVARAGRMVLRTNATLMQHSIGEERQIHFQGKLRSSSNHSPERRYYMARNHTVLVKEYWRQRPSWVVQSLWARAKTTVLMLMVEDQRGAKLRATLLGICDGIRGRMGVRRLACS